MHITRAAGAIILWLSLPSLDAAPVEISGPLSSPTTIQIPCERGQISAIRREQRFSRRLNSGSVSERNALLLIVPERHMFWLGYKDLGIGDRRHFFALGDHIVGVSTHSGDVLYFYVSSDRMPSGNLDDCARLAMEERFSRSTNRDFDIKEVPFPMEGVLGAVPFEQWLAQGEPAPEITKITVVPGAFTLTFRGGEKHDIEASITFGSDFRPISATLRGKQVFPKAPTPSPTPRGKDSAIR